MLAAAAVLFAIPSAALADCTVTKAGYDALADGMAYDQVVAILGCEGEEMSSSSIGGISTVMLTWQGEGMLGANMNAMFQDGRLVMKAQFGLR